MGHLIAGCREVIKAVSHSCSFLVVISSGMISTARVFGTLLEVYKRTAKCYLTSTSVMVVFDGFSVLLSGRPQDHDENWENGMLAGCRAGG